MLTGTQIGRAIASVLFASLLILPSWSMAKGKKDKTNETKISGPAGASLDEYLTSMQAASVEKPSTTGSLWTSAGPLTNAATDYKAHFAGDIIIVRLADQFTAATSGQNKTSRQFGTQSGISGLLGHVAANNSLQNMFTANSASSLNGQGQSTMSSRLQVSLAGRVLEVFPNGVLLVEAARDFAVGNDRQTIVLRGLVRPGDIATDNSVLSSQVGSMELRIKGKGAVADATRQPNLVVRLMMKVLSF